MRTSIIISLEGQAARIVYGYANGGALTVRETRVVPVEKLGEFLTKEKAREFTVVNHFSDPFQDVITVPAVKKRLLRKIIEIEVRKRTGFSDFSFIHTVLGTRATDQGRKTDISVFAVKNDEARSVIERFTSMGKTVKALYPDVFVLARAVTVKDENVLCVSASDDRKVFSFVSDGVLQFTREVLSGSAEMTSLDIQNLDMTVNYCRQSLRVLPSIVMFTGGLGRSEGAATLRGVPTACLNSPVQAALPRESLADFTVPVLALEPGAAFDISPAAYRSEKLKTRLLKYSSTAFAAMAAFLAVISYMTLREAGAAKKELLADLSTLQDIERVVSEYRASKEQFERYIPVIETINKASASPDPARLMAALSALDMERITLGVINIVPADGSLRMRLEGSVRASSYSSTQSYFERFVNSFERIKCARVVERRLMIKDKNFLLEVDCG